jgi:hypothetical protein
MRTTQNFKSRLKLVFCLFLFAGTIRSFAQPLAANAGTPATICAGSNTTLGGFPTGSYGTGPYTYSWAPATGLSSTTVDSPVASPTVTTTYTVTVTDAVSATSNSTVTITVNPSPSLTVNSPTICAGSNATLTANPSGGTSPYTYYWSPSATLSSGFVQNPVASPATTTTYTVTVTDNVGCMGVTTSMVTVNPNPSTPTVTNNGPLCAGSTLNLTASTIAGATYSWNGPSGYSASAQNPVLAGVSTANAGVYSVIATVAGCTSTPGTTNVAVNSLPTVNAGADQTACLGNVTAFSATAPGAIAYSWDFGDAGTSTLLNPVHTYSTASIFNAVLTVTGSTGCTNSDIVQITVVAGPAITTGGSNTTCFGACDGTASATGGGGFAPYSYSWSPGGATTATAPGLCAGTYTVTVTNTIGCVSTANYTVNQPAALSISTSANDTICYTSSSVISMTGSGGTLPYTYVWNDGSTNFSTSALETVTPAVTTTYTATVTDASGCTAIGTASVVVSPNTNIYGHVTYSGGSLATGTNTVVLYNYLPMMTSFDTIMTTTIDAGGNYYFTADPGDYLIKVFNDTTVHSMLIPTYFGDHYLWDSATVIMHDCSANYVANIVMEEAPLISGPGHIDGAITEGDGFGRAPGDPIPGVDIKLGRNPGGQLVTSGQTNGSGQYSFDNIPFNIPGENYVIYVDIPGLERISLYSFVIDAGSTQFFDMDYEADSATIYTTQTSVGIKPLAKNENGFSVYPNPASENVSVEYTLITEAKISISVYNVLGVKVAELLNSKQTAGKYKQTVNIGSYDLNAGVYFISLIKDGNISTQRVVITK